MRKISFIKRAVLPIALATTILLPSSNHIVYADENNEEIEEVSVEETNSEEEVLEEDEALNEDSEDVECDEAWSDLEMSKEVIEINTVDICKIQLNYTKEVEIYDGFLPTGEIKTLSLNSTIELEAGKSLSSCEYDSEASAILNATDKLPDVIESGYVINAKIDLNGNVTITSIKRTEVEQDKTEVTVYEVLEKVEKHKDKKDIKPMKEKVLEKKSKKENKEEAQDEIKDEVAEEHMDKPLCTEETRAKDETKIMNDVSQDGDDSTEEIESSTELPEDIPETDTTDKEED
ncbi:MAG: hypothetical protein IJR96_05865 [Pseudobutyrivibrio sp.]|nr:hypothetical protein [Pseudobutyrivibrio sp.]